MDPRRARDPRLARTDPRLQRVQSESPAPPAPLFAPSFSQNAPPPNFEHEGPNSFETSSQENQVNNMQSLPSPSMYKPRPLFCVVCASNQV